MSTTDNGWSASPDLATRPFVINGVPFVPGIVDRDDVEVVLRYVMQRVADEVEQPVEGWCWGFGFRPNRNDPNELSRHSGGIALDLNAPTNPNGVPTRDTFADWQIARIHRILIDLDEACGVVSSTRIVRWGGDFNGNPDAMHFEINVTPSALPSLAARLRDHLEALMPLNDADLAKISDLIDARLEEFGKNAGELIKINHDGDTRTARWSLERVLAWLK